MRVFQINPEIPNMTRAAEAELLVYDQSEPCPYLPRRLARMPLRLPLAKVTPAELDRRLAAGERRTGTYFYRTECLGCRECQPMRIAVEQFTAHRTLRRTLSRGDRLLSVELGPAEVDAERLRLFNLHRNERNLAIREEDVDEIGYSMFLVDSCCDSFEIRYRLQGRLVMVAIADRGASSLSAVYTYFDPAISRLSPGVYSVLRQIQLCRQWNLRYLYLGFYVAGSEHMAYKARFVPHQRLNSDGWQRFDTPWRPT